MNDIAIMQGRLLPPYEGRFQAFPAKKWRDEFVNANSANLACIEWIYEKPNENLNPFSSDDGIKELRQIIKKVVSPSALFVPTIIWKNFLSMLMATYEIKL